MSSSTETFGYVHLRSWAGVCRHRVRILDETPKRYRVEYENAAALPRRLRERGRVQLVPKHAVHIETDPPAKPAS